MNFLNINETQEEWFVAIVWLLYNHFKDKYLINGGTMIRNSACSWTSYSSISFCIRLRMILEEILLATTNNDIPLWLSQIYLLPFFLYRTITVAVVQSSIVFSLCQIWLIISRSHVAIGGPPALSRSTEILSLPDALPFFICFIANCTSLRDDGLSCLDCSFDDVFAGDIRCSMDGSVLDDTLISCLKYSFHRSSLFSGFNGVLSCLSCVGTFSTLAGPPLKRLIIE